MIRAVCWLACLAVAGPAAAQGHGFDEEVAPPFGVAPIGGGVIVPRGWSAEAFWIGIASALGVLTAGITAVAIANPNDRSATGFGITSLGLLAVAAPTVALGGGSARGHPYVPGAFGFRLAGWITWSLSVAAGVTLLALDIDQNEAQRGAFMAPVFFGAVSLVLFAIDALVSAIQADLVSGQVR